MLNLWKTLGKILPWLGWILAILSFLYRNPPPTTTRDGGTTSAILHGR